MVAWLVICVVNRLVDPVGYEWQIVFRGCLWELKDRLSAQ